MDESRANTEDENLEDSESENSTFGNIRSNWKKGPLG